MQERTLARAFEPAFTTRKGAQGLGLATALSAMQRLGGALTAESTVGVGTTMRLFIPVPGDAAAARRGRRGRPPRRAASCSWTTSR